MLPTTTESGGAQAPADAKLTPTQRQMLELLGKGYPASATAQALGVTESYVSQMVALPWFAEEVQRLRFHNLQKQTKLDEKYDDFEDELLDRLKKMSKLLVKPLEINRVLQTINSAKRRGVQAPDQATLAQRAVQINLPATIINTFITNSANQVVEIRDDKNTPTELITIPSGALEGLSGELGKDPSPLRLDAGSFPTGASSSEVSQVGYEETISPDSLQRLSTIQLSQAGLAQSLSRTAKVTADDI